MSMPCRNLNVEIERDENNISPAEIIMEAQEVARQLVDAGGYIEMQRFTKMVGVTGKEDLMIYKTYITYLKKGATVDKVNLFSEKDGKAHVWLSFDNLPEADDFYKNFEADETVVEDITALILMNILSTYDYSNNVEISLITKEITKSSMFWTRGISLK